ncbi:response regulator [Brevundimonas diminuta]|nr:response regulator [Brevundimonas diminuta]
MLEVCGRPTRRICTGWLQAHMSDPCIDRRPQIILVQVDTERRRTMQLMLQGSGFDVRAFSCGRDALAKLAMQETCCLIVDEGMPDMNGCELLRRFRERGWLRPAILLTTTTPCCPTDAQDFSVVLRKPASGAILVDALNGAIRACPQRKQALGG